MKGELIGGAALVMSDGDTVATALEQLEAGRTLDTDDDVISIQEPIEFGHKFALRPISNGDPVRKYGEVIGTAEARIEPGTWVHIHNCRSTRGRGDLAAMKASGTAPEASGTATEGSAERRRGGDQS
jgi:altronate dehydratase small subunit